MNDPRELRPDPATPSMEERRSGRRDRRGSGPGARRARAIPMPSKRATGPNTVLHGAGLFVVALAAFLALVLAGCGGDAETPRAQAADGVESAQPVALAEVAGTRAPIPLDHADPIEVRAYMSPTCGCCSLWVEHLEENGFEVERVYRDDMRVVKQSFGITDRLVSCHTAIVNGYVVEGHVPAADIRRLLAEAPDGIRGLAVPGMPIGSPGMEVDDRVDPYDVLAIGADGSVEVFASYGR
jgi:hypothetical protein